jgi:hypothetical protein
MHLTGCKTKRLNLDFTRMVQTGKPFHSAERWLAYVLSSKYTKENELGRQYVSDFKGHVV